MLVKWACATTELGRDLAKSRHDQASPCPERVNKVNCVPRTARRKLQPFTKYPPGNRTCLGLGSDRLPRAQLTALRRTMSKRQQLHCTEPSHPPPLPLLGCSLDNFLPPARLPSPGCAAGTEDSSDRVRLGGEVKRMGKAVSTHLRPTTSQRAPLSGLLGGANSPNPPGTQPTHGRPIEFPVPYIPYK